MNKKPKAPSSSWWLYILRTRRGALYTGITRDLHRRFQEHCAQGPRCARCLRGQAPLSLVLSQELEEWGQALRMERRIKALSKARKEALVAANPEQRQLLWSSLSQK